MSLSYLRPTKPYDFLFVLKLLDRTLQRAMAPSLKVMFQMAGSQIWQSYGKRLVASSPFLEMAFQAIGEMMRRNEKSREVWISRSIAGNGMPLPYTELLQLREWSFITME